MAVHKHNVKEINSCRYGTDLNTVRWRWCASNTDSCLLGFESG